MGNPHLWVYQGPLHKRRVKASTPLCAIISPNNLGKRSYTAALVYTRCVDIDRVYADVVGVRMRSKACSL